MWKKCNLSNHRFGFLHRKFHQPTLPKFAGSFSLLSKELKLRHKYLPDYIHKRSQSRLNALRERFQASMNQCSSSHWNIDWPKVQELLSLYFFAIFNSNFRQNYRLDYQHLCHIKPFRPSRILLKNTITINLSCCGIFTYRNCQILLWVLFFPSTQTHFTRYLPAGINPWRRCQSPSSYFSSVFYQTHHQFCAVHLRPDSPKMPTIAIGDDFPRHSKSISNLQTIWITFIKVLIKGSLIVGI